MKSAGVQMFYALELPDSYAAKVAQAMQQQNFHPINIEGDAYSDQLVKLGGSAVNGMYIIQSYALYIGQDATTRARRGAVRQVDEEGCRQAELRDPVRLWVDIG